MSEGDGTFGSLVRRHRLRANLTHEALAARSSLSVDTISMLERGVRHMPRRSTVVALAQALRLPPEVREVFLAAAGDRANTCSTRSRSLARRKPFTPSLSSGRTRFAYSETQSHIPGGTDSTASHGKMPPP